MKHNPKHYYYVVKNPVELVALRTILVILDHNVHPCMSEALNVANSFNALLFDIDTDRWMLVRQGSTLTERKVEVDTFEDMVNCLMNKPFETKKKWKIVDITFRWDDGKLYLLSAREQPYCIYPEILQDIIDEGKRLGYI